VSAVQVCKLADVPVPGVIAVVVEGVPVAIVRDGQGGVHALRDVCSHADVALSEGEVDGCTLECWLHGSRFDVRTGQPSGPPATSPVPVYPATVEGEGDEAVVLVDVTVKIAR
jgi:3-phenylpropionate/trans-cinnamate dioxygenase ferredoxin component